MLHCSINRKHMHAGIVKHCGQNKVGGRSGTVQACGRNLHVTAGAPSHPMPSLAKASRQGTLEENANMAKSTKTAPAPASAKGQTVLDWNAETARIETAAKSKGGSWGDQVQRAGKAAASDTPAGAILRKACGDAGAQALIEQSRNVLAKLPRLAQCIAAGTEWCSIAGMGPDGRRKEDASVVVALASLGAGNGRQKEHVAHAVTRYPGGANAQMPAALEALAFFGIVKRKEGGKRNADYALVDEKRAARLMPHAGEPAAE